MPRRAGRRARGTRAPARRSAGSEVAATAATVSDVAGSRPLTRISPDPRRPGAYSVTRLASIARCQWTRAPASAGRLRSPCPARRPSGVFCERKGDRAAEDHDVHGRYEPRCPAWTLRDPSEHDHHGEVEQDAHSSRAYPRPLLPLCAGSVASTISVRDPRFERIAHRRRAWAKASAKRWANLVWATASRRFSLTPRAASRCTRSCAARSSRRRSSSVHAPRCSVAMVR